MLNATQVRFQRGAATSWPRANNTGQLNAKVGERGCSCARGWPIKKPNTRTADTMSSSRALALLWHNRQNAYIICRAARVSERAASGLDSERLTICFFLPKLTERDLFGHALCIYFGPCSFRLHRALYRVIRPLSS
jgi:hypothetical protein